MKTFTHTTFAERVGRAIGHAWAAYKRQERGAVQWMVGNGLTAVTAKMVLWVAKLLVLVVLFYVAFWMALLLAIVFVAAWGARHVDWSDDERSPEWRDGLSGFGLYDKDGLRVDPHDPDEQP